MGKRKSKKRRRPVLPRAGELEEDLKEIDSVARAFLGVVDLFKLRMQERQQRQQRRRLEAGSAPPAAGVIDIEGKVIDEKRD